ncbi:MAG: hypothetical protein BWK73_32430 [Thiothrix lacustris]|uniref:Uncharacterized protein n=1 Tax=Thiothrix lacustris TaxID=525917 RepID=A0A1Y1QHG2_9GAMM|nr:MAG: hypothetical protein BWK73_32430 [Thiothrix lacustris]
MKLNILLLIASLLLATSPIRAEEEGDTKLMNDMNSKMAQMKARMRAYEADMEYADEDRYALSPFDTAGCDINIGNVIVDDGAPAPDEIVVLVDGDIIQSNNCR